jgi:amylosucrase
MHRPPLDWEAAERRKAPASIEHRIFGWIRTCLALRRSIPAFAQDAPFEILPSPSENVLLCRRGTGSRAPVVVAANFAPERRVLALADLGLGPRLGLVDLLEGGKCSIREFELELEAYGIAWIAVEIAGAAAID